MTLSGNVLFSALDGSAQDSDGLANGVFTVNGDLVIAGTINCNDDPPLSGNASACPIRIDVTGDLTMEAGSGIFAENRRNGGHGGDIRLDVGGDLSLQGPGGGLSGAVVSSSRLSDGNSWRAGNITIVVGGGVELQVSSAVSASTLGGSAGTIAITAEGMIQAAGLIASGPSRTVLPSRWTGLVLGGGANGQIGGSISLKSRTSAEPAIRIDSGGVVASQGEEGGGRLVLLEGCGIEVRGLVASVSKQGGPSMVAIRSGKGILVDGRDLGAVGSRLGRIRADGSLGGAAGYLVDLFAANDIQVLGPDPSSTASYTVSSSPGSQAQRPAGGTITAISLSGSLTAAGKAFEAGRLQDGNKGGTIDLKAQNDMSLDGASLAAVGDFTSSSKNRAGGRIFARSYQGAVSWTFGVGDVRPTGAGVSAANRGTITLTACTTIDTTGTQFLVTGAAVPPFPVENEGVCSPSAPALPSGELPLPICDNPPIANNDTATVAEDDPATAINVLANDTDTEGDPFTIQSVTQPANGTVALTPAGPGPYTGLTYTPNGNYCNTQPGGVPDTFTYSLTPGGDTATVSVTVTCDNDNPVANDDTAALAEDDPATPIDVLANDTDVESDPFSIAAIVTPPANGTVALTPAGPGPYTGLTYTPNPNYCNTQPGGVPDTFTYSLTPGGDTATVSVTVTCDNDNPVANDDTATLMEDDPATPIDVLANDTDADNDSFSIAAIVTPPTNGTVALTPAGPGPYTGLTYTPNPNYCNTQPGGVPDTFTYSLTPGGDTATVSVTVTCINDNPVANDDTATLTEDASATPIDVLANDTDVEGDSFSIVSPLVTPPSNGTVALTPAGPGPYTGLTYTPNANYCNTQPGGTPDVFTYALTPGGDTATVSVTVTCVPDNPVANDDVTSLSEDALATPIDVLANDTDAEGDSFSIVSPLVAPPSNGTVALTPAGPGPYTGLTYTPNPNYCNTQPGGTPDMFMYALTPGGDTATVSVTVTCVNDNPVANDDTAMLTEDDPATPINVLANDTDVEGDPFSIAAIVTPPSNGTVALTPAGPGPYTGLTYTPNPNYCNTQPGGVPDTFTYSLTPGGDTATVSVTVTCVPDPPSCTVTPAYTTAGNTQLHVAGATLPGVASVSDPQSLLTKGAPMDPDNPGGPFTVIPVSGNTDGGDWVINMDGSFTFVPNAGFTGTATRTFQVSDNGSPAAIGTCTVNVTVTDVVWYVRDIVDANNAAGGDGRSNNAFEALASAQSPVSGPGHYIYVFEGNTATTPHVGGFALADGQKLWGQGIDLDLPSFPDLVTATNRARVRATAASINSVNVPATSGNRLNVEIRGLDLEATGVTSNAIDVTSSGANQVGVTISDNNIRGATAEGIDLNSGSTGAFSVTVQTNTVTAAGNGIDTRVSATGTATVTASSNMITSTAGNAFDARTLAGASALRVALSSSNVAAAGNGVVIDGSAAGTTTITSFLDNTVHQSTLGTGVSITSATFDAIAGGGINTVDSGMTSVGTPGDGVGGSGMVLTNVQGDLHFSTNLSIFAENGSGLFVSGTGVGMQFRVASGSAPAAVGIIEATGGPAVDASAVGLDLRLTSLKSTNTPTRGVSLENVSDGATNAVFSAGSGSITTMVGATGPIFNVSGGNADISYAGTIINTSAAARAVSLTTWSGDDATDDITLSGAIDENGAGILVNGNGGSRPITFSGGMDIDTTTGEGFAATSNTNMLHITGTNTIDSVSATALRVTSTTIGSSNLNVQHISSGNNTAAADPANGIVLNNTGASGRLIVTGTGGAGTGGTIQSTTGAGISLTSTMAPSFASMNIQNTARSGVKGTLVNGFSLTNTTINNSGTAAIAGSFDSNIAFNDQSVGTEQNLTGTVSITGNTLTNAQYHGVDITNFNGTIADLTLSNNTITSSTSAAASLGSGVNLQALGSATTVANVTRVMIANNIITNFPSGAGIQALGANANAAGPAGTFGTPGSGTNVISITGNRVAGQSAANRLGTNGILVGATGKGQANFDVSSNGTVANPLANIAGFGIGVSVRGAVTVEANVTNNILAPNNTFASPGISVGADSLFAVTDAPNLTSTISNNSISQSDGNGILATVRNSNGIGRFKIQNNTVAAPLSGVRPGIRVDSGTASGNTTVCLNMSGNTSAGSGGSQGLGLRKQGTVTTTNAFGVNGMAATSSPGVEAFIDGLNPAGNGTLLISATSGFSNCSLP